MNISLRRYAVATQCVLASLLALPIGAQAGMFGPTNWSECILSRMPGAANDVVAYEIAGQCAKEFSATLPVKKQTGLFSPFQSGSECTQKKAKDTGSLLASRIIRAQCYRLYEPTIIDPADVIWDQSPK